MAINTQKVVVGGLAAGVVIAAIDFVVNGVLLADQNEAAMNALNPGLMANMEGGSFIATMVVLSLAWGILIAFTYAAMRPRFGEGPKTALIAGGTNLVRRRVDDVVLHGGGDVHLGLLRDGRPSRDRRDRHRGAGRGRPILGGVKRWDTRRVPCARTLNE